MTDEWSGIGGSYVYDPETDKRYPKEVWDAMQRERKAATEKDIKNVSKQNSDSEKSG